ncbi:MAG: pyridoxal-phosphate dependent enzyme [Acidobacteriota bacterium]
MDAIHIKTPLIESLAIGKDLPGRVWLKMEALQPSGSFKLRGIGFACRRYAEDGATAFVSSSGGNAGLAVAHAGRRLGVPVTVVVPESTTERAKELIAAEGAQVKVIGRDWAAAHAHALELAGDRVAYVHPFDDPLIWEGHATLIDEVADSGVVPDAVVLSVGGGGLLCGVVEGLRRQGWGHVPVIAVETAGADSLAQSLAAGEPVELDAITSVATSLGARRVADRTYELAQEHPVESRVVSDRAAIEACHRLLREHRLLTEPACGAAIAAVEQGGEPLSACGQILVIVCGGVGVDLDRRS